MIEYKENPMFSVCIPVYNVEKYLKSCVQSVLEQNYDDYEIILINNGSKDSSGEICDEYAKEYPDRIRVVHKSNEGILLSRYEAASMSGGKYILFLDSDDMFAENTLERLSGVIENTDADLIIFDFLRFFNDKHEEYVTREYENQAVFEGEGKKVLYRDLIGTNTLNTIWSKCIRRDVFNVPSDYMKYKGLNMGEDKILSLSCFDNAEKIVYLKETLYQYRANEQSVVNNITLKHYKDMQTVENLLDKYIEKWNMPEDVVVNQKFITAYFGISCVASLYKRMQGGLISKDEFKESIKYIAEDSDMRKAYKTSVCRLSAAQKITYRLLFGKKINFLILLLGLKFGYRRNRH